MKLPGSLKIKKIVLLILVIVSIVVIINVALNNRKNSTNVENKDEKLIVSEDNNSDENITVVEESKEEIEREEESLYKEAYNSFFAGEYSNAIEKANNILEKFPESYKAYNIRGIAKAFFVNFDEGMKDIDKSLEINPDYGYARYNKAFNYELYEKFDDALLWYDKALEIEQYMWSYYGKASIYGRRGDVDKTVENLKKALEIEGAKEGESGIKKEARTEKDFDPVRDSEAFNAVIS